MEDQNQDPNVQTQQDQANSEPQQAGDATEVKEQNPTDQAPQEAAAVTTSPEVAQPHIEGAPVDPGPIEGVAATSYVGPAPTAPYHLIDTEHAVINLIAQHLEAGKEEALELIHAVNTQFSNLEVQYYKARVIAWLLDQ